MGDLVRTQFNLWPVWFDEKTHRYQNQSPMATTNPWTLMQIKINKIVSSEDVKKVCLACLEQAEFFHNSQLAANNYAAKALLVYYSAMNLVKAYLIAKNCTPIIPERGFMHGFKHAWKPSSGDVLNIDLQFEKTAQTANPQRPPPLYSIFDEFLKSLGHNFTEQSLNVKDYLSQIVIGHRVWAQAQGEKKLFIPIDRIEYMRDSRQKTITIRFKILKKHIKELSSTKSDFLTLCNISDIAKICSIDQSSSKFCFELNSKAYNEDSIEEEKKLADEIRSKLWTVVTAHEPYRKYYFYAGTPKVRLPDLGSMYILMFCLGEISRYRPHKFHDILDGAYGPQIIDFLNSISNQFLYLLGSNLLEKDIERPAIV